MKFRHFGLTLGFLLLGTWAHASDEILSPPAAPASTSTGWAPSLKNVSGSYGGLLLGPTLRKLDGDTQGRGHYISLRNYLSLNYNIDRNWRLDTGWEVRQTWRPKDPKNPNRKDLDTRDPFAGVSRRNILRYNNFSLGGRIRYFIPASDNTKSKVGRAEDAGKGEVNGGLTPSWQFLDGDVYVACPLDLYVKIPEQAPAVREDYSVRARPLVSYQIARKFAAKVEYQTGYLRHTTNGKWSKFNDRFTGQKVYLGVTWAPTRALSLNPSLNWGSDTFRLNRGEVSLFTTYAFL